MKNKIIISVSVMAIMIVVSVLLRIRCEGMAVSVWWSERTAGMIGGGIGVIFGGMGGLVGILGGTGKCWKLAKGLLILMTVSGALFFIAGLVAYASGQSWAVYYLLLLTGVILGTVAPVNLVVLAKRQHELELRRMESLDS